MQRLQNSKPPYVVFPSVLGYRAPAEWEEHESTWLAWPHGDEPRFDDPTELLDLYVEIVRELSECELVRVLVENQNAQERVMKAVQESGAQLRNIQIYHLNTTEIWLRDTGPIFIKHDKEKKLAVTDWIFNGWGNKYEVALADNELPGRIASLLNVPWFQPAMILEGGSIDSNGHGTCLATEQCLLNKNRNSNLKKNDIEQHLKNFLGFTNFVWLAHGMPHDDTDGHIDTVARFVDPHTVVSAFTEDAHHPYHKMLTENFHRLTHATDQSGRRLRVIKLPIPVRMHYGKKSAILPANYANFYIANSKILVPTYADPNDDRAIEILQHLFPNRKVAGIRSDALITGLGAIHCITQQQPKV